MTNLFPFVAIRQTSVSTPKGAIDADRLLSRSKLYLAVQPPGADVKKPVSAWLRLKWHHALLDALLIKLAQSWAARNGTGTAADFAAAVANLFGAPCADVARDITRANALEALAERHMVCVLTLRPAAERTQAATALKLAVSILAVAAGDADAEWRAAHPGAQFIVYRKLPAPVAIQPPANPGNPPASQPQMARPDAQQRRKLAAAARVLRAANLSSDLVEPVLAARPAAIELPSGLKVTKKSANAKAAPKSKAVSASAAPAAMTRPLSAAAKDVFKAAGITLDAADNALMAEAKLRGAMMAAADERREFRLANRPGRVALTGGSWLRGDDLVQALNPGRGTPSTKGTARVLGTGLLMRVVDEVIGYQAGAVAKIANFPKGMKKESEAKRLSRTEETSETAIENRETTQTSRETDERSSLKEESEKALHSEMSLAASGGFSASYGPVGVEASASAETSLSSDDVTRTAGEFAKRVVEKASSEIVKKQSSALRVTRIVQTESRELEGLDNTTGAQHVSAIYHWVDEVHEGRLMNYGARLMLEFMVPEPGRALMWSAEAIAASASADEPPPFDITIDDIDEDSYLDLGVLYAAGILPAPPEAELYVSKALKAGETISEHGDKRTHIVVTDDSLTIPEGYALKRAYIYAASTCSVDASEATARWSVSLGWFHRINPPKYELQLREKRWADVQIGANEGDLLAPRSRNVPVTITGLENRPVAVSVVLRLRRTQATFDAWRSEVCSALRKAHQRLLSDAADRRAQRQPSSATAYTPRNPARQRQIEREEIKRGSLEILTGQHFERFGSIQSEPGTSRPLIDFSECVKEGSYIRFFETAFEWEQIDFVLYPYFWANPAATWQKRLTMSFDDAQTEAFMRAGYARVVAPVRPGFEAAILRFLQQGPNGVIDSAAGAGTGDLEEGPFVAVWQEVMERQGQTAAAPVQIDSWRFSLPTGHQIIRADNLLPAPPAPAPQP
jgi:hypothetical protein